MMTSRSRKRSRVLVGSLFLTLGSMFALSGAGCETLPDIAVNYCGNKVTEPTNFEDCDGDASKTLLCGERSTPGACRWLCDYAAGNIRCPAEWGCGLDGICRKSAGLSEAPISIAGGGTTRLLRGDFDGDGRDDIAAAGLNSSEVYFLTTEGFVERSVSLPNGKGVPAVGDVDNDGLSDLVLALNNSVAVLSGQESRSFIVNSRPMMFASPGAEKLLPLGRYLSNNVTLALGRDGMTPTADALILQENGSYERKQMFSAMFGSPVGFAGATGTKKMDGTKCVHIAFEQKASKSIATIKYCDGEGVSTDNLAALKGKPWAGVYFADIDHDGVEDLLFGDEDGGSVSLKIIRDFVVEPPQPPAAPEILLSQGTSPCGGLTVELAGPPLAIGDLNDDNYPDFVDSRGVILHNPMNLAKPFTRVCLTLKEADPMSPTPTSISWEHAVLGDFNGDGHTDILASRAGQGALDFWTWQPNGLLTVPIFVGAPVAGIVSGDIDGDSIMDAAFWFDPPPGDMMTPNMGPTPIYTIFGNLHALPSDPRLVGFVMNVQDIAIGRVSGINLAEESDILSDLLVLSSPMIPGGDKPITLMQGSTSRTVVSPVPIRNGLNGKHSESGDMVNHIAVSDFGVNNCANLATDEGISEYLAFNVITLGSNKIWRAGCYADGTAYPLDASLNLHDNACLFAPVDPAPDAPRDEETGELLKSELAAFLTNPIKNGSAPGAKGPGVGTMTYENDIFTELPLTLNAIDPDVRLPNTLNLNVPFDIADVDGNGRRDVILTAHELVAQPNMPAIPMRRIRIYWDGTGISGDEASAASKAAWLFEPKQWVWDPQVEDLVEAPDLGEITGIVAINLDGDRFKELAVMTKDNVYLMDLNFTNGAVGDTRPGILDQEKPLVWFNGSAFPFATLRGGRSLLALDANSDGIDDLAVADVGKLLLYLGTEQSK